VESVVILNTAEGECVDDFSHLATNPWLVELVGHWAKWSGNFACLSRSGKDSGSSTAASPRCDLLHFRGEQRAKGLGRVTPDL